MRRFVALIGAFILVSSLTASSVTAAPVESPGRTNSFVGNFDFVDQGVVIGHVVANFKEPTSEELVPGSLDIYWAPDTVTDPYWPTGMPFAARESHGQILRAAFWGAGTDQPVGGVQGYLCDYVGPQNASCHPFQMGFGVSGDLPARNVVGFGTFDWCCDGRWYDVGEGSFNLTTVTDTPGFPWEPSPPTPPPSSGTSTTAVSSVRSAPPVPPTVRDNSFVGNFDIVDRGVVLGRVVASFKEPTAEQFVPGSLDINWAPDTVTDPYWPTGMPFAARESHGRILRTWFWDDTYPEVGHTRLARVQGYLCDYVGPQDGGCHGFQMAFADIDDDQIPNQVGFGTFDTCCDGQWHDVGQGSFVVSYIEPTPEPGFLERWGTELALDGQPFHEISLNAYDLLEMSLDGRAAAARDELQAFGKLGFRVLRVMASPYDAAGFERAFFDSDPVVQAAKRDAYFATFDALLDNADAHGIRIVASLMWNVANIGDLGGHSVREGMTNPTSPGRLRVEDYIREVVTRYADRPTIAMWELGNEWNLGADIQWPQFDYTSDDLAAYYAEAASLIRGIDGRHLITTGDSSPRPSAMHLLRAVRAGQPVDWTPDSAEELNEYINLVNPEPIDVVSIHYYDDAMTSIGGTLGSPANLAFFKGLADEMGKPLFVGEIGCTAVVGCLEGGMAAVPMLRETLPVLVGLDLPIVLYWYAPTVPTTAVRLIQQADRQVR